MQTKDEEGQRFSFPDEWDVEKFDDWSFYRGQFSGLANANITCPNCKKNVRCANCQRQRLAGTKGIDFLAIESDDVCWQIEVKDYRQTRVSSFVFLADAVALKVRDTLACLVVARTNSNNANEQRVATRAVGCKQFRVVLQLEQPVPSSRLDTKEMRRARILQRLKQLVKGIDVRPLVVDRATCGELGWTVTDI